MSDRTGDRTKERGEARAPSEKPQPISTFAPARNFTIPLAARVRAAAGPPAYAVRKRRIEDLEEHVVEVMREVLLVARDEGSARRALEAHRGVERELRELARLIADHNRYYPVEGNLPLDPKTGALLERGQPWKPLPLTTFDALFACAIGAKGPAR